MAIKNCRIFPALAGLFSILDKTSEMLHKTAPGAACGSCYDHPEDWLAHLIRA